MGSRISSGVPGLDRIINGGLIGQSAYLIRGGPGMGKTTLGLQFLSVAENTETSLFIGFQESDTRLKENAQAIGLDVSQIHFLNLSPDESFFVEQERYDIFSSDEVEHQPLADAIVNKMDQIKPSRVFIDSLTQLRYLTSDVFQYRKEILSFISYLTKRGATVLFTSENSQSTPDDDLQFLADGVITLSREAMGQEISVNKFRGSGFIPGSHQMRNSGGGIEIFPRPIPPKEELVSGRFTPVSTGIKSLDTVLHGGLEMGTVTMITGPSGIGKSTLSSCIAESVSEKVGHTTVYLFEEEVSSYFHRAGQLSIGLGKAVDEQRLDIEQIEPMKYLADEFAAKVYDNVLRNQTRMVVFDSTAGFQLTLMEESMQSRLHALAKSLARINVSVLLINETSDLYGDGGLSEKGISYLSDNVITLAYDREGTHQSVLNVVKKRLSDFDRNPYRYQIGPHKVELLSL